MSVIMSSTVFLELIPTIANVPYVWSYVVYNVPINSCDDVLCVSKLFMWPVLKLNDCR